MLDGPFNISIKSIIKLENHLHLNPKILFEENFKSNICRLTSYYINGNLNFYNRYAKISRNIFKSKIIKLMGNKLI